jgi:NADPH:quinone reductase-like Zn-dependent oxidoreductase
LYGTASTHDLELVERLGAVAIDRSGWIAWYATTACVGLAGLASPRRSVLSYRIAKPRDSHPDRFRDDLLVLVELLRQDRMRPVTAEGLPLTEARRAHQQLERFAAKGKLVLVP